MCARGWSGRNQSRAQGQRRAGFTAPDSLSVGVGETRFSTGSLSLADVASELDGETLRRLKRECGGLQTLLKNNHQVFEGKGIEP